MITIIAAGIVLLILVMIVVDIIVEAVQAPRRRQIAAEQRAELEAKLSDTYPFNRPTK